MSAKIRVSIVEDDPGERELYASVLSSLRDMVCVSQHPSAAHAVRHLPEFGPEVVLVDVVMPGGTGIECVRQLKPLLPGSHFLMLTKYVDDHYIFESFKAGAIGYLLKARVSRSLPALIRQACREGAVIPPEIARQMLAHFQALPKSAAIAAQLTAREEEVLRLVMQGLSSKEIAVRLGCSANTVDRHAQHICEKLQVSGRHAAASKYFGSSFGDLLFAP